MKDGRAKIGYGYILVPMDFPDYDTIPNYEEWEDEVMDSGYFHYVGPDKEMFFGIIMEETDSFVESIRGVCYAFVCFCVSTIQAYEYCHVLKRRRRTSKET